MTKEPSGHLYMHAQQFFEVAEGAYHNDRLVQRAPYAIVVNYAFCVEMLLKACDSRVEYYGKPPNDFNELGEGEDKPQLVPAARIQSNISGHGLVKMFDRLDITVSERLEELFLAETGGEIQPLLEECKDYFIEARYPHDVKTPPSFNIHAIKTLASGLINCMPKWNR